MDFDVILSDPPCSKVACLFIHKGTLETSAVWSGWRSPNFSHLKMSAFLVTEVKYTFTSYRPFKINEKSDLFKCE